MAFERCKIVPAVIEKSRTRSYNSSGHLLVTEHFFEVPFDHSEVDGETLTLFARSIEKRESKIDPDTSDSADKKPIPWLLFLQGGPGFGCKSPQNNPYTRIFLDRGYKMIYLDQRGTGLSSPLSVEMIHTAKIKPLSIRPDVPEDERATVESQANFVSKFRADNIVRDCEAVRMALTAHLPASQQKWSIMGQSFGGFCCTTYLSFYPDSLREAFIFGGLPPLVKFPDQVYQNLQGKLSKRNHAYYEKFPHDVPIIRSILSYLRSAFETGTPQLTQRGINLSCPVFQQIGLSLGFHGGLDSIHDLLLRCENDLGALETLRMSTLSEIEAALPYDNNIIYAILHEAVYCQNNNTSNWSANRVVGPLLEHGLYDGILAGEMIFPFMFDDYPTLHKLKDVATFLAEKQRWPDLYDEVQLANNTVPVYAAVYLDDMYVDYELSMQTAKAIRGCKTFVTNMMFHDAVRSRTADVLKEIFRLRDDVVE